MSNETIQGVQFVGQPDTGSAPLICDSSSDFLSRPIDVARYGLIYACAQKNAGISGVTAVIVRDDLLERVPKNLSASLDYANFAKNDSRPNTPPTFAIYVMMLVGRWIRDTIGGLDKMAALNVSKAKLLYDAIDTSGGFYRPHARADCRSKMNVTFRLPSEDLEKAFVKEAAKHELMELKGHRSVGGIRASIYNARPLVAVETLAKVMADFVAKTTAESRAAPEPAAAAREYRRRSGIGDNSVSPRVVVPRILTNPATGPIATGTARQRRLGIDAWPDERPCDRTCLLSGWIAWTYARLLFSMVHYGFRLAGDARSGHGRGYFGGRVEGGSASFGASAPDALHELTAGLTPRRSCWISVQRFLNCCRNTTTNRRPPKHRCAKPSAGFATSFSAAPPKNRPPLLW